VFLNVSQGDTIGRPTGMAEQGNRSDLQARRSSFAASIWPPLLKQKKPVWPGT
jgi:hypothetical protein